MIGLVKLKTGSFHDKVRVLEEKLVDMPEDQLKELIEVPLHQEIGYLILGMYEEHCVKAYTAFNILCMAHPEFKKNYVFRL